MMKDRNTKDDPAAPVSGRSPERPARRLRAGTVLLVVLAVGGLVLGYEYRESLFGGDAGLWLLLLVSLGMHLFLHRGHGTGGGGS